MPRKTYAVVLALLLTALSMGPALAAPAAAEAVTTFGVQPAGSAGRDARGSFVFGMTPGASVKDHVALVNYSASPVSLDAVATDALTAADGGFTLKATKERATAAGSWLRLDRTKAIKVPARSAKGPGRVIVPFEVRVPADASPGDHSAGILAVLLSSRRNNQGAAVRLEQRVGTRVHLRVSGKLTPGLAVDDLRVTYDHATNPFTPGTAVVSYLVRNTGNISLAADPVATVSGLVQDRSVAAASLPLLLPGAAVRQEVRIRAWPQLLMAAEVRVTPRVIQPASVPPPSRALSGVRFLAVPWVLLLVVMLLVGGRAARGRVQATRAPASSTPPRVFAGRVTSIAVVGVIGLGWTTPARAEQVPYRDPGATGTVTLCDKKLRPITEGSIVDRPFVWRAVGSQRAPSPYDGEGRLATLFAFQPIEGVGPGEWVGEQIVGPARYTATGRPTSQFTEIDYALEVFLDRFPPRWNGLVQLRLMYGAPGRSTSTNYAAMDLKVTGNTWSVVRGGATSCGATADAVSFETALPDFAQRVGAARKEEAVKASARAATPAPTATVISGKPSAAASREPVPTTGGSAGSGRSSLPMVAVLLGLAAAAAAMLVARKSRPAR